MLQSDLAVQKNEITRLHNELAGLKQIMDNKEAQLRNDLGQENLSLRQSILHQRKLLSERLLQDTEPMGRSLVPNRTPMTLEECFAELEPLAPRACAIWRRLLDVNAATYEDFPAHSCSVDGHPMAELFNCFLKPYLRGTVLDIGCGPQPMASYLQDYPPELIAGIDPVDPPGPHPFVFVQGVCEFLPWVDHSFDVVVAATSLDHVLLLDKALTEIRRVLKPEGRFVAWVAFVAGAPKYDPYCDDVQAVDDYHLFHFDQEWFEGVVGEFFMTEERFSFRLPYNSRFYCFQQRHATMIGGEASTTTCP